MTQRFCYRSRVVASTYCYPNMEAYDDGQQEQQRRQERSPRSLAATLPKSAEGGKTRILDEFVAVAGCHRKHAVRLLGQSTPALSGCPDVGRRVYDEAVREALIITWEAADRICGKRLKEILPSLVDAMERHDHLCLDRGVRKRLLSASAVTIDTTAQADSE